ncbi:MAG: CCA tRNA nucleotidyltransferase [Deltaproteobacteria bacterium]|nr:CCA tRNA nucleotidyltransferase [Deltaproteobacteria bacterium]
MRSVILRKPASYDTAVQIVSTLSSAGHEAYLVGGCVRDLLRGVEPLDYDIVTSARPEDVCSLFPHTAPVGANFGVILVIEEGHHYEVATFRSEGGYEDGRRPNRVAFTTVDEDVFRRDFTINALFMDPKTKNIVDYVGGREDLKNRIIRSIGDPEKRFSEDYLRMLRAVRFAANLDFEIDSGTFGAIRNHASAIHRISAERIRDELTKILTHGGSRRGMEILAATGLLEQVLPEVSALRGVKQPAEFHPEGDVWEHILQMLAMLPSGAGVENESCLAWGIVMHDIGKALTYTEDTSGIHFHGHVREGERFAEDIMRRLRFSRAEAETILALIHCHMMFMNVKEMRPNRLKRFLGMPHFELHLELHRLDCLGSHGSLDNYDFCRARLIEIAEEELHPPRLLSGRDLIDMGLHPGPLFSKILRAVEDAQLDGAISTSDEARRMVMDHWGNHRSH